MQVNKQTHRRDQWHNLLDGNKRAVIECGTQVTAVGDVGYGEAGGGTLRVGLEVDPEVARSRGERQRR